MQPFGIEIRDTRFFHPVKSFSTNFETVLPQFPRVLALKFVPELPALAPGSEQPRTVHLLPGAIRPGRLSFGLQAGAQIQAFVLESGVRAPTCARCCVFSLGLQQQAQTTEAVGRVWMVWPKFPFPDGQSLFQIRPGFRQIVGVAE